MTPHYADDWITVYQGDAAEVLRTLPDESVHCCVTSPPFFGLRDYGVPGQIGLEPTPEEHIAALVNVFREVSRVLRSDGTLWLEYGDAYNSGTSAKRKPTDTTNVGAWGEAGSMGDERLNVANLAAKQLLGMPWRVAFALQADGWYLRSDIIWSRPNPMPESVTDRPTKSHSYVFLLAKSPRYFFDQEAVREESSESTITRAAQGCGVAVSSPGAKHRRMDGADRAGPGSALFVNDFRKYASGRNIRSVWTIPTQPYPGAHFATFPEKLVQPCIKAGTSERGVCPECGAPWVREVERTPDNSGYPNGPGGSKTFINPDRHETAGNGSTLATVARYATTTTGWRPGCAHGGEPVPATCLDPFAGTGTVGLVAQSLSRRAVLIDLNGEYLDQCLKRNAQSPLGLAI